MVKRVDLASATQGSVGEQGGATGSVELRGAASRSVASPLTARQAARLTARRTQQPAVQRSAQASAGSLLLQAQRGCSSARSEFGWGTAMRVAIAGLRGCRRRRRNLLARGAVPRKMKISRWVRMAEWAQQQSVARWRRGKWRRARRLKKISEGRQGEVSVPLHCSAAMRRGWAAGWRARLRLYSRGSCVLAWKQSPFSSRR